MMESDPEKFEVWQDGEKLGDVEVSWKRRIVCRGPGHYGVIYEPRANLPNLKVLSEVLERN